MTLAKPNQPSRHQRAGFNLVEAAIVLGVIGLVIGGIWVAASAVKFNFEKNRRTEDLILISEGMRKLFPRSMIPTSGQTVITSAAFNAGIFPGGYTLSGENAIEPTSGLNVRLRIFHSGYLTIISDMSSEAMCIALTSAVSSKFDDNTDLMLISISKNGGTGPFANYSSWPLDPGTIDCRNTGSQLRVHFDFSFLQ